MAQVAKVRGYTLIELLVIAAIVALLGGILLPSLAAARDQARTVRCLANLQDMSVGVRAFAVGHGGRFQLVTSMQVFATPVNGDREARFYEFESGPLASKKRELLVWPVALAREAGVRWLRINAQWGHPVYDEAVRRARQGALPHIAHFSCPADTVQLGSPFWPSNYFG